VGRPGWREVRIGAVTTGLIAVLGPLAGLLWAWGAPAVRFTVLDGRPVLADPESQNMIAVDGRFAVIAAVAGVVCGVLAYLAGGRDNDIPLLLGLAAGGLAAASLAWWAGHQIGLGAFEHAVATAADGRTLDGPADLRARGVLVLWPLLAVAAYGLLETAVARLAPRDLGPHGAGEPEQVGGGEFDLQAAPPGGDKDRVEP
jgi:hypothetical protein